MLRKFGSHLRDQWMGALALFLVLGGGTAYAVTQIDRNSVKSKHIVDGEVKNADIALDAVDGARVADGSLSGDDVADNSLDGDDVDESGLNGVTPSGAAGGDLQGDYPNPTLKDDSVDSAQIANNSVGPSELASENWHVVGTAGEPAFNSNVYCGWGNWDNGGHQQAAFFRDHEGIVHLSGLVDADDGTGAGGCLVGSGDNVIFTLPPGYRPAGKASFLVLTNGQLGRGGVLPGGTVMVEQPTTPENMEAWVSIEGLSFPCAPSGQNGCP